MPTKRLAIIWTNEGQVYWRMYMRHAAPMSSSELNIVGSSALTPVSPNKT